MRDLHEWWLQLGGGTLLNLVQRNIEGGTCIISYIVDGAVKPQLPVKECRGQCCQGGCCLWKSPEWIEFTHQVEGQHD